MPEEAFYRSRIVKIDLNRMFVQVRLYEDQIMPGLLVEHEASRVPRPLPQQLIVARWVRVLYDMRNWMTLAESLSAPGVPLIKRYGIADIGSPIRACPRFS